MVRTELAAVVNKVHITVRTGFDLDLQEAMAAETHMVQVGGRNALCIPQLIQIRCRW